MNISVQQFRPFSYPETVRGIVAAYQHAFGGEPWNEGYVCPVCDALFPLSEERETCGGCAKFGKAVLLVERWPTGRVMSDFYREMMRPEALCLVAKNEFEKVVGFIWGYRIAANEHIDEHLEAPGLSRLITGEFFYIDEAAVIPEYQRQGIGKRLVAQMLKAQPEKNVLARTLDQSQMFRILTDFGGKTVQKIMGNRVIMAISL